MRYRLDDGVSLATEVLRRHGRKLTNETIKIARQAWQFLSDFFDKQRRAWEDENDLKAYLCSRRAGKTDGAARALFGAGMEIDESTSVYIGPTRKNAKNVMWEGPSGLKALNRRYHLGAEFNETELVCTLPNASRIILVGAHSADQIDKLRGLALRLVIIDEAQIYGAFLEELIEEVVEPALMDYLGSIVLMGTPSARCEGFFYRITCPDLKPEERVDKDGNQIQGWTTHRWTLLDNPHIPKVKKPEGVMLNGKVYPLTNAAEWLEWFKAKKGWRGHEPKFLREYGGLWRRSAEDMVYEFRAERNAYDFLPKGNFDWIYGLAVDFGYDDPTGLTLMQCAPGQLPDIYAPWSKRMSKGIDPKTGLEYPAPTAQRIAAEIKKVMASHDLAFVVVDQGGGAGKIVAADLAETYGIPCIPAEKTKKETYIGFMNGDLRTGRLKLHRTGARVAIEEMSALQWDPDPRKRREDPRFPNDVSDTVLYGWREMRKYLGFDEGPVGDDLPAELRPAAGSEEADAVEGEGMERAAAKEERRRRRDDDGDEGGGSDSGPSWWNE